jgi:serine/threonine protein kinase
VLKAGDRIGDWIIEHPLGEGGMGAVFRVHSALSERVEAALKVMKPSLEPDARARFVREAEALSALRHPAIVRVMGFSEDLRRGLLYLVMELAEGETLKRRLEKGPLALPEALATFGPLAAGLEHAHAAGISHRDLKPSNVILAADGVRLVDFGIAAAAQSGELTGGGQVGTLSYLPPEVFRGEHAEPRAIDIYGFGLLLDEALTGAHPFPVEPGLTPAAAVAAVGMRKLRHPALDPGPAAPAPIRDLVRRATDPDPRARPTMAEARRVLESLVERRAGAHPPAPAPAAAATPASGAAAAPAVPAAPPARVPAWTPPPDATTRVPDPVLAVPAGERTTSHVRRRWRERRRSVIVAWLASVIAAAALAALAISLANGRRPGPVDGRVPEEPASPSPAARSAIPRPPPTSVRPSPSPVPSPSVRPSPSPTVRPSPSPSPSPFPRPELSVSPDPRPATPRPRPSVAPDTPAAAPPGPSPEPAPTHAPTPIPTPTPSPSESPSARQP